MAHAPAAPAAPAAYTAEHLDRIAYPLGGLGSGGMCLTGPGGLVGVALRHHPDVFNEPLQFASLHLFGVPGGSRVLEGPYPSWRAFTPRGPGHNSAGGGCKGTTCGFPHFTRCSFRDRFPMAEVALAEPSLPVEATLLAWSPFIPGDADASSQPVIVLEYALRNTGDQPLEAIVGFHSRNHLGCRKGQEGARVEGRDDGFVLCQDAIEHAHEQAALRVACDGDDVAVDTAWFRGGWFDTGTMLWRGIAAGAHRQQHHADARSPGGSVTARLRLAPGETRTVRFRLSWYVPFSQQAAGHGNIEPQAEGKAPLFYRPRYAALHRDVDAVDAWFRGEQAQLRQRSFQFGELLASGDLPPELREAVVANLGILRSTTVLRQFDGRLWLWEGSNDKEGSCYGSCTHVWNWAQATAHLFPELERGLRETEHTESQLADGGQCFRVPLPIQQITSRWWTAADGQLGGLIKTWRDWHIGGDSDWLRTLWPRLQASIEHCIRTWDPERVGVMRGPQHNTYDIEFHGPNGMMMSLYLGALLAVADFAAALGEDPKDYAAIAASCRRYLETELWDGRSFIQQLEVRDDRGEHLRSIGHQDEPSPELQAILEGEGPRYQYTTGVLATALQGEWMAEVAGLETGLDRAKVKIYLEALITHNLRRDLSAHANPQRASFAFGSEGGLLLCTWPDGDAPSLPFPYSEEVWTGMEYQTAGHLLRYGEVEAAREVLRLTRARYDGRVRNPFNEMECGHWYGRALAAYDLIAAWGGARYDALTRTMHLHPAVSGDLAVPFIAGSAWGLVGIRNGEPFYDAWAGELPIEHWELRAETATA